MLEATQALKLPVALQRDILAWINEENEVVDTASDQVRVVTNPVAVSCTSERRESTEWRGGGGGAGRDLLPGNHVRPAGKGRAAFALSTDAQVRTARAKVKGIAARLTGILKTYPGEVSERGGRLCMAAPPGETQAAGRRLACLPPLRLPGMSSVECRMDGNCRVGWDLMGSERGVGGRRTCMLLMAWPRSGTKITGGIMLGATAGGGMVYVEPPSVVGLNNELMAARCVGGACDCGCCHILSSRCCHILSSVLTAAPSSAMPCHAMPPPC